MDTQEKAMYRTIIEGARADVRLGKSAPILLKALKEIVEVARGDDHAGKPKRSLFDDLVDIEKIALDAIARAGAK